VLAEEDHPEQDGHGRIDVGDDGRPGRSDLGDEGEEEQEGQGRAEEGQPGHGGEDLEGGVRRPVGERRRRVDDGRQGHRRAHHTEGWEIGEPAADDEGTEGVAHGRHGHLGHRDQVGPVQVDAHQGDHAGEADEEAEQATAGEPLGVGAEPPVEDDGDEGDGGDQEPGHRARQVLLGPGEKEPGQGDLGRRVGDHPPPPGRQRAELSPPPGQGDEEDGGGQGAGEDEGGRRELPDGHPDEEVRGAPDDAHGEEQQPAAPGHPPVLAPGVGVW